MYLILFILVTYTMSKDSLQRVMEINYQPKSALLKIICRM